MNVELRMWNFELVARRAMKNYSIKNYLASYSMFLLVSPSTFCPATKVLGRDGRGFFIASFNHKPLEKKLGACTENPNEKLINSQTCN